MSKGDRARERAKARRIVEHQKAAERRRMVTIWTSVAVVMVLVTAGLLGWGLLGRQRDQASKTLTTPAGVVDAGTAWAQGKGPVVVDLYEDFLCPVCRAFEEQTGPALKQLISENKITVQYHTVAILDDKSQGTRYSTRAAGAAAAAAVEGKFVEYHDVLYANQPRENTPGLTDAKLIELGKSIGLTSDAFVTAVNNKTYDTWVGKVTDTFGARHFTGTPSVAVAGKQVTAPDGNVPTTDILLQKINEAAGSAQ